jgi:multiple sugar transport system permease protein
VRVIRWVVIAAFFFVAVMPLAWLVMTSLKAKADTISTTAKFVPSLAADIDPESHRFRLSAEGWRQLGEPLTGTAHSFFHYFANSVVIAVLSTLASVALGTACAYGFSRFRFVGARDWLFFVLSTRFLPPLAVVAPVLLMYRQFNLENTHLGLIILYTSFNLSLSVWLMKGFIDEIPRNYEEAALVDGYSHLAAFRKIILPHAATGMAVTAVFCLISALNEFAFAKTLNMHRATTVPVYFAGLQGNIEGIHWPQLAAGVLLFVTPVAVFTVLVRRHLLRGVTFGTVKQ